MVLIDLTALPQDLALHLISRGVHARHFSTKCENQHRFDDICVHVLFPHVRPLVVEYLEICLVLVLEKYEIWQYTKYINYLEKFENFLSIDIIPPIALRE